jgi:hypothetical protein
MAHCSFCEITESEATYAERERIIKLLEDYSDGGIRVLLFYEIATLIKGQNK